MAYRASGVAAAAVAVLATGCAFSRGNVKSLGDRDASRLSLDAVIETSIAALNAIPSHCGPTRDHRVRDEEFRVYQVVGRIGRVKRERDHDIHVVLEDPDNPRLHMIVESADPDFRRNVVSPHRDRLVAARQLFEALLRETGARRIQNLRGLVVRVTGVGFFDVNHFQIGRSRSCIELHPILAIERAPQGPSGGRS